MRRSDLSKASRNRFQACQFSASKIAWLLDHVPDARAKAERGELAFGTVDVFLAMAADGWRRHHGGVRRRHPDPRIASDRQAALIGQACFAPGMLKSTYGTAPIELERTSLQAPPQNLRPFSQMRRKDQAHPEVATDGLSRAIGAQRIVSQLLIYHKYLSCRMVYNILACVRT
jgi:glycerol kinase